MAKVRHVFVCRSCGGAQHKWQGKCPDCGAWDSLEEQTIDPSLGKDPQKGLIAAWGELSDSGEATATSVAAPARPISEVDADTTAIARIPSGIDEFDRVLGGANPRGLVPGSAVLIGGEPGIGKSTLLLQAATAWAAKGARVLYVSSEESAQQVAMRAHRLSPSPPGGGLGRGGNETARHAASSVPSSLFLLADTNLARIVEQTRKTTPQVLIIDSVQMIYKADLPAGPGSITQLRRCCSELVYLAKASGIGVVLVGHVTKDGQLAGPRLLEHLVDAVLSFDGDRHHSHRIVRATKNRFGATLELGLFEMTDRGLIEVPEGASLAALADAQPRPGTVICPVMTGTRCLMVELQALTATGFLGAAKRKSSGLDSNRLAMLIAVLEQHAGLRLADRDVFASSVGGIKVAEPAADLALLLAIAGAHYKRSLAAATCAIGEVGLGGEVRPVAHLDHRLREAARLGFKAVLLPKPTKTPAPAGIELIPIANVDQAIQQLS